MDQKTELKKSLEKTVATLAEVLEEKVELQRQIFTLKEEVFNLHNKIIRQHNKLCDNGLEEYSEL